jgi:outer membrane protein assembly factor BamB
MVALVATAVVAFPVSAAGQQARDAEWSQFQGGPGHPGTTGEGPAPPYRERWRFPAPEGRALSGAVLVGGLAITVGQRAVYGVDVQTGDVVWQVPRDGGPLSIPAVAIGPGREPDVLLFLEGPGVDEPGGVVSASGSPSASPSASPSVSPPASGEAGAGVGSDLVAIDLSDRSELWRAPLDATSKTGVTVEGEAAYVADDGGNVYAFAVADGEVRWTKQLDADGPCEAFIGRIDAPLAVADGRVISVARNNDDGSVAVSAYDLEDGGCLWRIPSQLGTSAASAPAAGDGRVVVGLADRVVRSLDAETGEQQWGSLMLTFFLPVSSPALGASDVYAVDVGGGLSGFDVASGERRWSYQFNEQVVRSSPVVSGGAVLLGLNDGRLVAVDPASGHLVWQSSATPGLVGAIAVAPEAIVVVKGGRNAGLIAFEPDPDGVLVDVPSPTELDVPALFARFGIAAAIAFAIVLVPGVLARRRFGDAFVTGDEESALVEEDA